MHSLVFGGSTLRTKQVMTKITYHVHATENQLWLQIMVPYSWVCVLVITKHLPTKKRSVFAVKIEKIARNKYDFYTSCIDDTIHGTRCRIWKNKALHSRGWCCPSWHYIYCRILVGYQLLLTTRDIQSFLAYLCSVNDWKAFLAHYAFLDLLPRKSGFTYFIPPSHSYRLSPQWMSTVV